MEDEEQAIREEDGLPAKRQRLSEVQPHTYNSRILPDRNTKEAFRKIMLLHIHEDIHGYIYEPHSEESEYFYTTFEGSEALREAG